MYTIRRKTAAHRIRVKILLAATLVILGGIGATSYFVNNSRALALQKEQAQQHALQRASSSDTAARFKLGAVGSADPEAAPTTSKSFSPSGEATTKQIPPSYRTYTNSSGHQVEAPNSSSIGATAACADGTYSHSETASGTCSDHGGVYRAPTLPTETTPVPVTCNTPAQQSYTTQYTSAVNSENVVYQSQLEQIQSQYNQQLGGSMSGMINNSISQASDQHQQNLGALLSSLNYKLSSINCPTQ